MVNMLEKLQGARFSEAALVQIQRKTDEVEQWD
jgi:hypothetical protein